MEGTKGPPSFFSPFPFFRWWTGPAVWCTTTAGTQWRPPFFFFPLLFFSFSLPPPFLLPSRETAPGDSPRDGQLPVLERPFFLLLSPFSSFLLPPPPPRPPGQLRRGQRAPRRKRQQRRLPPFPLFFFFSYFFFFTEDQEVLELEMEGITGKEIIGRFMSFSPLPFSLPLPLITFSSLGRDLVDVWGGYGR